MLQFNDRSLDIYRSQNFIFKFFIRKLAMMNIKIICVSSIAKKEFMKLSIYSNNIEIIPAYITKISTKKKTKSITKKLLDFTKNFNKIIVFYASKYFKDADDIYGVTDVLKMLQIITKRNNDVGLVFCLSDLNSDLIEIKENASNLGLSKKIFWQHGPIKNMYDLWELTDVYVRPTIKDGDSLSIREALEMNVGVVASDVAIRPKKVLVFKNRDIKDFSSKVNFALSKRKNEKNDKSENFYKKILSIYKNLIHEN